MNDVVVGMGEALWDVLPEGKKIGGAPACRAVWSALSAMMHLAKR